jgi:large subunit ribosomal protein L24
MPVKKVNVKKNDKVVILSGKDKGKQGKVLTVIPKEGRVIVEGVNMLTKHVKPRKQGQTGGIIKQEGPIDASNVMHLCNKCNKPTRIARRILDDGSKVRYCKNCDEVFGD